MASPPLIMTPVPREAVEFGYGVYVTEFIEGYCRITKESLGGSAGTLLRMRRWQNNTLGCVFARRPDGRLRHRQALIGLPRKNGKSALGSSMGLYGLIMGDHGSEIYSCAADKDQARIVFNVAKRMVELDPQLDSRQGGFIKIYRDALEYTEKGSIYKVISSEAFTKEGLNPNTIIYDELHAAPTDELYNVMTLAQGSRKNPLFIAITTAGVKFDQTGEESICYRLYQYGANAAKLDPEDEDYDPTFFMAWWGAPDGADHKDPKVWEAANPGYGDLIDPEDFSSVLRRVHENEFRTKRLNQWVSSQQAWLPAGAWDKCRTHRDFTPTKRGVVLGFDGSQNNDTTALVAVTVSNEPQVMVLGIWSKPDDDPEWQVPRAEVKDMIRSACKEYNVREIACDPYLWKDAMDELEAENLPVVAFPQTITRMSPATQRMYERVISGTISHDGNKTLSRHFENCHLKVDSAGSRIIKDRKNSPRKIDAAIATVIAADRADFFLNEPGPGEILDAHGNRVKVENVQFVWDNSDDAVAIGQTCVRCGNPRVRELHNVGFQVVCRGGCDGQSVNPDTEPPDAPTPIFVG